MARWKPGGRARLVTAAFELFSEKEFAEVTGQQIAERAGLTERTFFRHFTDKRDVLFTDTAAIDAAIDQRIFTAKDDLTPLMLAREGLLELDAVVRANESHVRLRERLVASLPELRERERTKHAHIEDTLTHALIEAGVDHGDSRLAAAIGMTCFSVARQRWLDSDSSHLFPAILDDILGELADINGPPTSHTHRQ